MILKILVVLRSLTWWSWLGCVSWAVAYLGHIPTQCFSWAVRLCRRYWFSSIRGYVGLNRAVGRDHGFSSARVCLWPRYGWWPEGSLLTLSSELVDDRGCAGRGSSRWLALNCFIFLGIFFKLINIITFPWNLRQDLKWNSWCYLLIRIGMHMFLLCILAWIRISIG